MAMNSHAVGASIQGRIGAVFAVLLVIAAGLVPLTALVDGWWHKRAVLQQIAQAESFFAAAGPGALAEFSAGAACERIDAAGAQVSGGSGPLASWQTIGGCGAGASTGGVGGVKWIGRNVRGGLFKVECQANYVDIPEGHQYVGTSLVSADVTPKWNLGVNVPYLYKYMNDPFKVGVDLANKGPGDVNLLLTRRLGATNDWTVTLSGGLPTGTNDVAYLREPLPQDWQLGLGKPTAALTIDHTIDNLWGPVVLGGTANWRGGENQHGNYRAPTASLYSYVGYLLGPLVPAAGLSLTGFAGPDRDRGSPQAVPGATLAAHLSLEWATDWMAVLVGTSLPADFAVKSESKTEKENRFGYGWTFAIGLAFAPL
jgi:hypothetical protein